MANSNGKRFTLVNDLENVIKKYLEEWKDTVTIGREYNVSAAAVQEILIRHNITRDYRKKYWCEKIKELNKKYYTYKEIAEVLNLKVKKVKWICYECGYKFLSKKELVLKDHEEDIKRDLEVKSISFVAEKYGLTYNEVATFKKRAKVKRKTELEKLLEKNNPQILKQELENNSYYSLAKKYCVSYDTILQACKKLNVTKINISESTKKKLLDYGWCLENYKKYKSYKRISEILGDVGQDQVKLYLTKLHGIKKYEVEDDIPELKDKNILQQMYERNKTIAAVANELSTTEWIVKKKMVEHGIDFIPYNSSKSVGENELFDFIKTLDPDAVQSNRVIISPREIDIVSEKYKIAIEYCGLYWHSSRFKDENYHLEKYNEILNNGYRPIFIYENEWLEKREIVKNRLTHIFNLSNTLKVGARKTKIVNVDTYTKDLFLNKFHIQGSCKASITIGLEYNGELVSLMTFRKSKNVFELNRFVSKYNIAGGFTKLLNYAQTNLISQQIKTYADLRWVHPTDNVYSRNGFKLTHYSKPSYMYVVNGSLKRREYFMRKNLEKRLKFYDPVLTERENTELNNFYRIYDCGKAVYVI